MLQRGMSNAVLVGKMNIRQLRVRAEPCQPPSSVRHSSRCFSVYGEASRDNTTFGTHRSYHYHTAELTGGRVYRGQFALYGGDGYLWSFSAGYERYDLTALMSNLDWQCPRGRPRWTLVHLGRPLGHCQFTHMIALSLWRLIQCNIPLTYSLNTWLVSQQISTRRIKK